MRILIIGCGAAGATAAQFARKAHRTAQITVVSREPYGEYSKCGLPYVIGGTIPHFDSLIEYAPAWFRRFNIDLRLEAEVRTIDSAGRTVTVADLGSSNEEILQYDSLVLAAGAQSTVRAIPGVRRDSGILEEGVFTLRTLNDARAIAERMSIAKSGMIVGSGLIGMEMAEAMSGRGIETHVRLRTHVLTGMIDEDIAHPIEAAAEDAGIRFARRTTVSCISGGDQVGVTLRNLDTHVESRHQVEMVVISAGTEPETAVASSAGCAIDERGGIIVDSRCRTSVQGIYAAGDCTSYPDFVTGQLTPVGLGSIAVRQGRVAGTCAAGVDAYLPEGLLNARTTRLFGLEIAAVGPTLVELRRVGIEPVVGKVTGSTRPEYFPGGTPITVKVMADPKDGRMLGAQLIGGEGAHLRVNTLAAAVFNRMAVHEFVKMETCYAPPVAPVLDCMTLAADAASIKLQRTGRRGTKSGE